MLNKIVWKGLYPKELTIRLPNVPIPPEAMLESVSTDTRTKGLIRAHEIAMMLMNQHQVFKSSIVSATWSHRHFLEANPWRSSQFPYVLRAEGYLVGPYHLVSPQPLNGDKFLSFGQVLCFHGRVRHEPKDHDSVGHGQETAEHEDDLVFVKRVGFDMA